VQNVYYTLMRNPAIALALIPASFFALGQVTTRGQSSALPPASDSHEGLTISAEPWTDPGLYKQKFPKGSPFGAGIVAVQVAFRNDTNDSMKIDLNRIRLNITLSEDSQQGLEPLAPEDVADVAINSKSKDPTARRKTIPLPTRLPRAGRDKKWTQMVEAARDAAVPGSIVAPHQTMQGLLYFDLQGQLDLLSTARLYVPDITELEKNHPLLYFDIDLSRSSNH
jgi:hypothetical protein